MINKIRPSANVTRGKPITIEHDGSPLTGTIALPGGKHGFSHALPVAALANQGVLYNVPNIIDANSLIVALRHIFANVVYDSRSCILVFSKPRRPGSVRLSDHLLSRSRSLFGLLPTFLAHGHSVVLEGLPRGCKMGDRPTSWYFDILEQFGVEIEKLHDEFVLTWDSRHPANLTFQYPTMTGTVMAIAAAAASGGTSSVQNGSVEPSCIDELTCVRGMGARVEGSLPTIRITGSAEYPGMAWEVSPDRVHACTYLTAGLLTRGEVTVTATRNVEIPKFIEFLQAAGARVTNNGSSITAGFPGNKNSLDAVRIEAGSEPLFSSDWIAPAMLLLAVRSKGVSVITDNVFPDRLQCLENLRERGMDNVKTKHTISYGRLALYAEIYGEPNMTLEGGDIGECPDLRGSTAIALAALVADGPVHMRSDFHLRRGYEDLPGVLAKLRGNRGFMRENGQ